MHDVFRAVTLSFLIATLYFIFAAMVDFAEVYLMAAGDHYLDPEANFRMALATTSLLASLLCVWVLLVTAFAKRYISRLKPGITLLAALAIATPMVLLTRLLPLFSDFWTPTVNLIISLLWSSVGLHAVLWYLTSGSKRSSSESDT
jgi:hypothetical protein